MIIISDSSPFIALTRIGCFELLRNICNSIIIPPAVYDDVCIKGKDKPGDQELRQAIKDGWIKEQKPTNLISSPYKGMKKGEIEAISLFLEIKADFLLMDESPGRARALTENIPYIGTLDILLRAKQQGLIPEAKKYLQNLHKAGFRMSAKIVKEVLNKAGEL